jgi:hypothetical protein
MKRLLSAVLALTLLGTTAAVADPYGHGGQGYIGGYQSHDNYRGLGDDNSGIIVAGVGLVTLVAILASQHHRHWHRGWYGNDGYRYGASYGYGPSYSYKSGYGFNGSNGYADAGRHDGWYNHDRRW